jgi:hypothetical protein
MGTHNYRLQFTRNEGGRLSSAFPFKSMDDRQVNSTLKVTQNSLPLVYTKDVGCRERVMDFFRAVRDSMFSGNHSDFAIGIRCFGEMYAKNAEVIEELGVKNLEKLFKTALGVVVKIRVVDLSNENLNQLFLGKKQSSFMVGKEKITRTYYKTITMYIRSRDCGGVMVMDCRLSTVLAILRENRLVKGICEGVIKTSEDLMAEIFSIAADRSELKDDSYDVMGFSSDYTSLSTSTQYKDLLATIKTKLRDLYNLDGSDYVSMSALGTFIGMCQKGFSTKSIITENTGPADYVRRYATVSFMNTLKKNPRFTPYLTRIGNSLQRMYSRVDFYDQSHLQNVANHWGD